MGAVSVTTTIEIDRPRAQVAAFSADPLRGPDWYVAIRHADWLGDPVLAVGNRISLVAHFLGKRISYVYEISEYSPGERLVMTSVDGPIRIRTTYAWEDAPSGGTRMTLLNEGDTAFVPGVAAPIVVAAMKRTNQKDLRNLKRVLESA